MKNEIVFYKNDIMPFGKYEGQKILDIYYNNPSYLIWANENVKWFKLGFEVDEWSDWLWD